jgi:signal transduction histidine kinase
MSQILALIAHDLKNALGGLEGELERLRDAPDAAAATQAHAHCQGLREQFVQFLTLYGAEQGQLRALCEDESPQGLLDHMCVRWRQRLSLAPHPLEITVEVPCDPPPFWYLDVRLVHMALDAAIHNASRFARNRITLSCAQQDADDHRWLALTVADDGPGLGAANDHDRDHATGLGSALCQAIAEAHVLGRCRGRTLLGPLDAQSPGLGTRFVLSLP